MNFLADESVLDDPEALQAADRAASLRSLAFSGARTRHAATLAAESGVETLAVDGRPRAALLVGSGVAGRVAQAVAALAGQGTPIPVATHAGAAVPAWVGPLDLVVALVHDAADADAHTVVEQVARRGSRLVVIGPPQDRLATLTADARGLYVATGRLPGQDLDAAPSSMFWPLLVPALRAAEAAGITRLPIGVFATVADLLDEISTRCRPASDSFVNPAKTLALELGGHVPLLWAASELAAAAAARFADQLAATVGYPALAAELPAALAAHSGLLAGPFGAAAAAEEDFFRDRVEEDQQRPRARVVLVGETTTGEGWALPGLVRQAQELVERHGLPLSELRGEGTHPLAQLATLVQLGDYASLYLALASGLDPAALSASWTQPSERLT